MSLALCARPVQVPLTRLIDPSHRHSPTLHRHHRRRRPPPRPCQRPDHCCSSPYIPRSPRSFGCICSWAVTSPDPEAPQPSHIIFGEAPRRSSTSQEWRPSKVVCGHEGTRNLPLAVGVITHVSVSLPLTSPRSQGLGKISLQEQQRPQHKFRLGNRTRIPNPFPVRPLFAIEKPTQRPHIGSLSATSQRRICQCRKPRTCSLNSILVRQAALNVRKPHSQPSLVPEATTMARSSTRPTQNCCSGARHVPEHRRRSPRCRQDQPLRSFGVLG